MHKPMSGAVGSKPVKSKINVGSVGSGKPVNPNVVQKGGSAAEAHGIPLPGHTDLKGAVEELHTQHPIAHHDHGPHHGTDHHVRHHPVKSGMYGSGGYGR
jgi:hypothetical protein